jgi:hypothetical protein
VLAILLIVSAGGLNAPWHIGSVNDEVAGRARVFTTAGSIELAFANARRSAREFAHTGRLDETAAAEAGLAKTREAIDWRSK